MPENREEPTRSKAHRPAAPEYDRFGFRGHFEPCYGSGNAKSSVDRDLTYGGKDDGAV